MTRKIRVFFTAALVVSALASAAWAQTAPPAGSPVDRHGALKVVGNKIVSSKHGGPVALRGMSFFWNIPGWNQAGYYTADVVNTLADDWKVDVVRVAISPAAASGGDMSGATKELDNNNWKTVVAAAKAKGLYVIVDFHAHNKSLKDEAVSFFSGLSKNADYKNVPNIIYEIFNEPCPAGNNSQNGGGRCGGDVWATDIKPYAADVVNAIRAQGDTNIVIIGTPNFSKRVDEASASPVAGKNLAYALHYYTGHAPYMGTDTASSEHRIRLRDWAKIALNNGVAVFVSEFGISEPGGGTGGPNDNKEKNIIDTVEARVWFDFLDENQIGWANWTIGNKPEAASALTSGGVGGGWTTGSSTSCRAWDRTTPVTNCNLHGDLRCSGSWIRTKLKYYATPVTFSATASGDGAVSVSPQSTQYFPAQQVTLTAAPRSGSRFEGWSGGVTGNLKESPKTIILKGNTAVGAVFFPNNLISNSTFTANADGWVKYPTSGAAVPDVATANGELVVTMPSNVGSAPDGIRVEHQNTSLTNGKKYKLTFDARATQARTIQAVYRIRSGLDVIEINIGAPVSLTTTMRKDIEVEFNMTAATTTAGFISFYLGGQQGNVTFDNVKLVDAGQGTSVAPQTVAAHGRTSWSVAQSGGVLQLRGPVEAGAKVSLYDTRGKMVKSAAAQDGMTFGVGVPAGNYLVVVKNRAGMEVMKSRVSLVK
jgi:endoglucanase